MSADTVGEEPHESLAVFDDEIPPEAHVGTLEATCLSLLTLGTTDETLAPNTCDAYALENNAGQLSGPELLR